MIASSDIPPLWRDGVAASGDRGDLGNARDYLTAVREGKFAVIHTIADAYNGGLFGLSSDCTDNPWFIAEALKSSLESSGRDASALDPTGRKSREEMEDEVAEATRNAYIAYARRKFASAQRPDGGDCVALAEPYQALREHIGDERPDQGRDLFQMRLLLENTGLDASVLDPTGKRSAAEMEREIRRVEKEIAIREARKNLETMRGGWEDDSLLRRWLERAGVDASVLDPTGRRSAAEMELAIREASREGHLVRARDEYKLIYTAYAGHSDLQEDSRHKVYEQLALAGVGIEALQDEVRAPETPDGSRRDPWSPSGVGRREK